MIALVKLTDWLFPLEDLRRAGIPHEAVLRFYYDYGDSPSEMMDSQKYKDEVFYDDAEKKYYTDKGMTSEIDYYLIKDRPEKDIAYGKIREELNLVDLNEFCSCWRHKFEVIKTLENNGGTSVTEFSNAIEDKLKRIRNHIDMMQNFNNKCDIHVGGGMIATFNSTMLLEDSCTDILQQHLEMGWRIIACCVQPDQRRPDYILGRYNPSLEGGKGAVRG